MASVALHPAQRFAAPSTIETGKALKAVVGPPLVALIAESLAAVVPAFDARRFRARATRGLDALELKARAAHVAAAMTEQLPEDFDAAGPLLVRSFGPPLAATGGNGLAPFFYFPHATLIAERGVARFASGMAANYELTKRFTAEFSVRPFLVAHRDRCLKTLRAWTRDPDPHVRRLVSEGTRPRLPWASRLPELQADPHLALPLLEALKDDPSEYVRRSVANHVGDVLKDHAAFAYEVCERWIAEIGRDDAGPSAEGRRWIVRHAVRLPAKKGERRALGLRKAAAALKRGR
jgi:3-methyladenine DNA glycosylase AlkC